jgi:two-component system, chemotaxis family, response regulator Rcp1
MSGEMVRILLVEDNAGDVYLFRKALENAELNFELNVIEDGAEALAFARQEGKYAGSPVPDLALLDLNLPKNEGIEVLKAMRHNSHLSKVPVVITSTSATPRERADAERLGVQRYIMKPLDLESFLQIGTVLKEIILSRRHSTAS